MSKSCSGTAQGRLRRGLAGGATLLLATALLAACEGVDVPLIDDSTADAPTAASTSAAPTAQAFVATNVDREAQEVPVDTTIQVNAKGAVLTSVDLTSAAGAVPGKLTNHESNWTATELLEPGTDYVVRSLAERSDGKQITRTSRFRTQDLTLDQQTYPSVAPLQGETVGVGMPVVVTFDLPVTDRAAIERHMTVESTPSQPGTWHWLSSTEAHWRPKAYWKADTDVSVDIDINSIAAGGGIYGQESRVVDFQVGDAVVSRVDAQTHQMKTFLNGELARTTPITTGKPGFTTRSGVKVIMEKFRSKRMNSETVGIPAGTSEAYDLDNVEYAMRVTYSGEFLHAAPWSVGSQGYANVSHGCTGMSTENAAWFYNISKRGDVVEYTGTDRQMTLDNGYGDWNESFAKYRTGSAL